MHRVRDNRAGQGFALLAGGLISLVEDSQQLGMRGEHAGIEVCGDLVGVRRDDEAVAWTTLSDWSDKRDGLGASVRFDTVSPFVVRP